ncbi:MAG: tautomerase family protein [bacterium]|nr:tautomerase family protein [bacterium]
MPQVKIYGIKKNITSKREQLSEIIHSCIVFAFNIPADKRFHRFIPLDKSDFIFPADRSDDYIIIELSIFEGRSIASKKTLINMLLQKISLELDISSKDIEITIFETPVSNWGIRGKPGDELKLNYKVSV